MKFNALQLISLLTLVKLFGLAVIATVLFGVATYEVEAQTLNFGDDVGSVDSGSFGGSSDLNFDDGVGSFDSTNPSFDPALNSLDPNMGTPVGNNTAGGNTGNTGGTQISTQAPMEDDGTWEFSLKKLIYQAFVGVGGIVTWVGGNLLDWSIDRLVVGFGTLLTANLGLAVNHVWEIVRDLINVVFIFMLIWIGLRTILEADSGSLKKTLTGLIAAALLINFSLFIAKAVVDFSNIAAVQISRSFQVTTTGTDGSVYNVSSSAFGGVQVDPQSIDETGVKSSVAGAFMESMKLTSYASGLIVDEKSWGFVIAFSFLIFFMMVIAGFVFAAGAILMIIRFVTLTLLMMFSPLMFVGWIYPGLKQYSQSWMKMFLKNAFIAPAYLFMLYIALSIVHKGDGDSGGFGFTNGAVSEAASGTAVSFGILLHYAIVIGFLIAAVHVAKLMGTYGSGAVVKVGMAGANWSRGVVTGAAKMPLGYGKRVGQNAGAAMHRNLPLVGGKSYDKSQKKLAERRARLANGDASMSDKFWLTYGAARGAGSLDDRAASLKAGTEKQPFGGKSTKQVNDSAKTQAQENANQMRLQKLSQAIDTGHTVTDTSNPQYLEMSEKIAGATPAELAKVLSKTEKGSAKYNAIVKHIPTAKIEELLKMKDDEFNANEKAALGSAKGAEIVQRITNSNRSTGVGSAIKDASMDDLKVLDLQTEIIPNAAYLQANQLDDMKKDNAFKGARFTAVKNEHENKLANLSMQNIIRSRKGEANIAKLPATVLSKTVGPQNISEFAQHLVTSNKLNNSLLTKIANRDDLDGSIKKKIGQDIIGLVSNGQGLNSPGFPAELKRFFEGGPGVQMR